MNVNKLRGKIAESDMNVSVLAKKIGVDRSTLYRKLNNDGDKLTIKEANQIVSLLKLTKEEAMAIFFGKYVA